MFTPTGVIVAVAVVWWLETKGAAMWADRKGSLGEKVATVVITALIFLVLAALCSNFLR